MNKNRLSSRMDLGILSFSNSITAQPPQPAPVSRAPRAPWSLQNPTISSIVSVEASYSWISYSVDDFYNFRRIFFTNFSTWWNFTGCTLRVFSLHFLYFLSKKKKLRLFTFFLSRPKIPWIGFDVPRLAIFPSDSGPRPRKLDEIGRLWKKMKLSNISRNSIKMSNLVRH